MKKSRSNKLLYCLLILLCLQIVLPQSIVLKAETGLLTAEEYEEMQTRAPERLKPRLVDDADILSDKEEKKLLSELDKISEKWQNDVVIVTTYSLGHKTATEFADDFFDYNGYGYGESSDGILLLISTEQRDWAISTTGKSISVFTDAGLDFLSNQFLPQISKGKYAKGFQKFVNWCDKYNKQAAKGEPYDYGHLPKKPLPFYWVIVSLVVGFLISLSIISTQRNNLKSIRRQNAANDYILPNSLQIADGRDLFLYRNVSQTVIPKNSGGSGGGSRSGSSSHSSSSGTSHGGSSGKF